MCLQVDDVVSSQVEKIGFDKKWLIDCLHRREQTKVPPVTYRIRFLSTKVVTFKVFVCMQCCYGYA